MRTTRTSEVRLPLPAAVGKREGRRGTIARKRDFERLGDSGRVRGRGTALGRSRGKALGRSRGTALGRLRGTAPGEAAPPQARARGGAGRAARTGVCLAGSAAERWIVRVERVM